MKLVKQIKGGNKLYFLFFFQSGHNYPPLLVCVQRERGNGGRKVNEYLCCLSSSFHLYSSPLTP